MSAVHQTVMSNSAAKALRDGAAGALAGPWYMAAGCSPLSMCTRTLAGLALEGSHVYSPVSEGIAFWMSRRLVVMGPFSVTRLMPPRGESKLITSLLWLQSMMGGGSGANFTRHVKFIVLPLLMNRSEPPRISVMGSTTVRYTGCPIGGVVLIWHS